jgi:hypothetical protein
MSAKTILLRVGQFALLAFLYLVFFTGGSMLRNVMSTAPLAAAPADQQWMMFPALILVSLVDAGLIMLVILRSNWSGWRLMAGVGISFYGVLTFMSQIETAYFGPALGISPDLLPWLFLQSVPIAIIYVPLAVWILGKARPWNAVSASAAAGNARLQLPVMEWVWKLALIAVVYVALYFSFGFIVAWQNPALRAMYGSGANQDVFNNFRLVPLQLVRGVLWALFALPIIAMDRGPAWKTSLVVGLWLALPMNIGHAIPNSIMPDPSVRLSHFIETSTSNFLFGLVVTGVILWHVARQHRPGSKPAAGGVN